MVAFTRNVTLVSNQKSTTMKKKIFQMMRRWLNVLNVSGKLDQLYQVKDYNTLGQFIMHEKDKRLLAMAKDCRDYSLSTAFSAENLIKKINLLMIELEKLIKKEEKKSADYVDIRFESICQSVLYRSATRRIYGEKLHFAGEMSLRNFDVNMAAHSDSRKVRRIVEKRMCQAYHRQNHLYMHSESNSLRHGMHRAVSYQLHNLGQIEKVTRRSAGSHWKQAIDCVTGQSVLKPKQSYSTIEEAEMVAQKYTKRHPNEELPMTAYKCAHCNKYHIGHEYTVVHSLSTA